MEEKLSGLGRKLNVTKMALTYVPSPNDTASNVALNRINPKTRNTFIVYVNRRVVDKFVNFGFDDRNAKLLEWSVRRAQQAKADSSLPWQAKAAS
jgi:protocatechuate 3,4-dioxygenase beta subunit